MIDLSRITTKSIIKFIVLWLILSGAYVIALSAATQALPKRVGWASETVYPLSVFFALIASFVAVYRGSENQTLDQAFRSSALIGAFGAAVLVIVYLVSIFVSPNVITNNELEEALNGAGLTETQKKQILVLLDGDYVTTDDLKNTGLNDRQIQDVLEIIKNQSLPITPAPSPIPNSMCYIQPQKRYATVSIRKEPDASHENAVGYLARGENIKVIGVALVKNDYWWKVEINHGVGSVDGWVIAWAVDINNADACNNVERISLP